MLKHRLMATTLIVLLVGPAVGCRSSWWWWNRPADSEAARWPTEPGLPGGPSPAPPAPATPSSPGTSLSAPAPGTSARPSQGPTASDPFGESAAAGGADSLQSVMAELNELGALDPEARDRLLADLPKTDPKLWPTLVQQFRAAAAYRREAMSGSTRAGRDDAMAAPGGASSSATIAAGAATAATGTKAGSHGRPSSTATPGDPRVAPAVGPLRLAGAELPAAPPMASPAPAYATRPAVFQQEAASTTPPPGAPGAPASGAVVAASAQQPVARPAGSDGDRTVPDWGALADFARDAESQLASLPGSEADIAAQFRLRLVYLLAGRRDEAMRSIPGLGEAAQQYWSNQIYALATWLDAERRREIADRAAETKRALDEAMVQLGEAAGLVVRGLAFCTEIQSYGCMTKFKAYEFAPGQPVLLYAEIDNFASEATPKGHHTALRSRYQILDSRGQPVADHDFTTTEEYCQNRRRDFFIGYHLQMPERIYPGRYTLKLAVEDLTSGKLGEAAIEFDIRRDEQRAQR